MIFNHRQTKKPALWITPYDSGWSYQENPNLYRIRRWEDMPDSIPYKDLNVATLIFENQGKKGLYYYFIEFIKEIDPNSIDDFCLLVMPSGFPDGVIPVE